MVVSYALAGDQIMLRLPDYNDIVHYAPGAEVHLEVAAHSGAEHSTVNVTGTAAVAPTASASRQVDELEAWPEGVQTTLVCVPLTQLEGFEDADEG